MNSKMLTSITVLTLLICNGPALSQELYSSQLQTGPSGPSVKLPPSEDPRPPTPTLMQNGNGLSDWITYARSCSFSPLAGDPPFESEIYLRSGWTIPFGSGVFVDTFQHGWAIEGGGKLFFFNNAFDSAWTLDAGLSNFWNHGSNPNVSFTPSPGTTFTLRRVNRTFVNLGFGKQWFLWGAASSGDSNLRFGADFGGRWGWGRVDTHQIGHVNDVIGGVYVGAFSDLEIPFGAVSFVGGFRMEWGYTWSDLVPGHADIQDLNLVFNAGVRF